LLLSLRFHTYLKISHIEKVPSEIIIKNFQLKQFEYVTTIMQFTEDNVGDIDATLKVSAYMQLGKRGSDKDFTLSIGYLFDNLIEKLHNELTEAEFTEAE
jgi:hypothetical protein